MRLKRIKQTLKCMTNYAVLNTIVLAAVSPLVWFMLTLQSNKPSSLPDIDVVGYDPVSNEVLTIVWFIAGWILMLIMSYQYCIEKKNE